MGNLSFNSDATMLMSDNFNISVDGAPDSGQCTFTPPRGMV